MSLLVFGSVVVQHPQPTGEVLSVFSAYFISLGTLLFSVTILLLLILTSHHVYHQFFIFLFLADCGFLCTSAVRGLYISSGWVQ